MKYIVALCFFALIGCKQNTVDSTNPSPSESEANQPIENPYQVFLVNVNQLRLRDAPGRDSKTIGKLPENSIVYSQNEKSDFVDTIELRMLRYIEPYYKVQSDQGEGWLFGGGLTQIYEGPESIQVPNSISKLIKDINNIPQDKISVGGWIVNRISDEDMSDPRVNDIYLALATDALYQADYTSTFYEETENAGLTDDDYGLIFDRKFDHTSNPYAQRAYDNGFYLDAGEGMIFPVLSIQRLADLIGGPFTASTKAYAALDDFLYNNPYMTDAAIYTPLEQVAKVLDRRMAFQEAHPNTAWSRYNEEAIGWTLNDLKYGSSNTPAFNYPSNEIFPEFKISWNNILKTYKDRPWIADFKAWVDQVEANDWKMPD